MADQAVRAKQSPNAPTNSAVATAAGVVFTLAAGEHGFIQNLDTNALAVALGPGASSTLFNWILRAGANASDGTGGDVLIDDWIGSVSVFPLAGGSYIAWKRAIG